MDMVWGGRAKILLRGETVMTVIKCMSEDIEATLDKSEDNIKNAIRYKNDYPIASKSFYTKSVALMESIKQ